MFSDCRSLDCLLVIRFGQEGQCLPAWFTTVPHRLQLSSAINLEYITGISPEGSIVIEMKFKIWHDSGKLGVFKKMVLDTDFASCSKCFQ